MKQMHPTMQRFYEACKEMADTTKQADAARLIGVTPQVLSNWEDRGMSKAGMIDAQARLGVSIEWLKTGKGQMHNVQRQIIDKSADAVFDVLDVRAACSNNGGAINSDHPEVIKRIVMPVGRALELIGSANRNDHIKVFIAAKDSMVPTIMPNDLLFVDINIKGFDGEGIYALLHGGEVICKRLQLIGRHLTVISDNKNYEPWRWEDKPDETQVVGRVLRALPMNFKNFGE